MLLKKFKAWTKAKLNELAAAPFRQLMQGSLTFAENTDKATILCDQYEYSAEGKKYYSEMQ